METELVTSDESVTTNPKPDPQAGCIGLFWVGIVFLWALGQWCSVMGFIGDPNADALTDQSDALPLWFEAGSSIAGIILSGGLAAFSIIAALASDKRVDKVFYSSFAIYCLTWPVGNILHWTGLLCDSFWIALVSLRLTAITVALIIQFNELEFPTVNDEQD